MKFLLTIVFLALGVLILINDSINKDPKQDVEYGFTISEYIEINTLDIIDYLNKDTLKVSDLETEYFSLVFLSSSVCPSCINNLTDYLTILSDIKYQEITPILLFEDFDKNRIDSFLRVSELEKEYISFYNNNDLGISQNPVQQIYFISRRNNVARYKSVIPGNSTTPFDHKLKVVESALSVLNNN